MFKRIIGSRTVMGVIIGILLVGFYLLGYFFSPYFMDAFIAFVMFLCINEMRIALRQHFTTAIENLVIFYSATIVFPYIFLGFIGVVYFTLSIFVIGASIVLFDKKCPPTAIQNMALIYLYPGLAMSSLLFLNGSFLNYLGLAVVLLTSIFTDMFAMFVGKLFGKHKLAAEISPKKTIEGAIGGLFGGIIGAGLVFLLFEVLGWLEMGLTAWGVKPVNMYLAYGLLSIFCAAFTQIGDLLASYFKRQWGIKDFSKLLGSHGGVLDRFDGIMLNSCFVSLIFAFIV